jgi:HAD superfamily hydrolase (TIGR01509 family)
MIRAILFDLDGTLLPLAFDPFFARYFERVCRFYRGAIGVDPAPAFQLAAAAMLKNEGPRSNAEVFWGTVEGMVPGHDRAAFDRLYPDFIANEAAALGEGVVADPAARGVVEAWRAQGAKVALATNPVFPRLLLELRARWGGLDPERFDLVTCYDLMTACKPHRAYYRQVADRLAVAPGDCLMVGNDVAMDLEPAAAIGMRTWLVAGPYTTRGGGDAFVPDHEGALEDLGDPARYG